MLLCTLAPYLILFTRTVSTDEHTVTKESCFVIEVVESHCSMCMLALLRFPDVSFPVPFVLTLLA
jgi:hypothetical protein